MNNKSELLQRRNLLLEEIEEMLSRELTPDEEAAYKKKDRELNFVNDKLRSLATDSELATMREGENKCARLREYFKGVKQSRAADTVILQSKAGDNVTNTIENSGAVPLTVEDLIDTQVEGYELPQTLKMVSGVIGDDVWPYAIDDAEVVEAGEIEVVNPQAINFDNVKAVSRRISLPIAISNKAIDNAAFDIYDLVIYKIQKAVAKYKALKLYSHASWTGNKGPFSLVTAGSLYLTYENILEAVANISAKGFTGTPVIIIDKVIEARLKATPLVDGAAAGFVIQNGQLAGYPYITSGFINKKLSGTSLVDDSGHFFGIGFWEFFALQQHGEVRLTTDATSAYVASKNQTIVTLNTEISMTELSTKVNGGDGTQSPKPQAFALYKIVDAQSSSDF